MLLLTDQRYLENNGSKDLVFMVLLTKRQALNVTTVSAFGPTIA